MKLKLYSHKFDLLELEIGPVRPSISFCEILVDGAWYTWYSKWDELVIKDFHESPEVVKNKIVEFYKADRANSKVETNDGSDCHKWIPGHAQLIDNVETWTLKNCKIVNCNLTKEPISITLCFDGANYINAN